MEPIVDPGMPAELREVLAQALRLAREAGRTAVAHLDGRGDEDGTVEFKGRRELVTAADRAAEQILVDGIRERFPEHAILAEEGVATPAGVADQDHELCWVLDPIDGTTNFVHGHPFWCVSVGVLRKGAPWAGVVHAPMLGGREGGQSYWGAVGHGAWLDDRPIHVSATEDLKHAVVGTGFAYNRNEPGVNTNLGNFGKALMEVRGIRRCGSAALDLALVAAGRYDAFWELYLKSYDVAAGAALILAAGGSVTDLGGGVDPIQGEEILATNGRLDAALRPLLEGLPR